MLLYSTFFKTSSKLLKVVVVNIIHVCIASCTKKCHYLRNCGHLLSNKERASSVYLCQLKKAKFFFSSLLFTSIQRACIIHKIKLQILVPVLWKIQIWIQIQMLGSQIKPYHLIWYYLGHTFKREFETYKGIFFPFLSPSSSQKEIFNLSVDFLMLVS